MDILICFDGTANEPNRGQQGIDQEDIADSTVTNVLRLHLCAGGLLTDQAPERESGKIPGQLSIYLAGVGTRGNAVLRRLRQAFAFSKPRQIRDKAIQKLEAVYEKGDRLFVFGFSRGAAIARKFCATLGEKGVRTRNGELDSSPIVEFLGAWDTVAALRASAGLLDPDQEPDNAELLEDGPIAPVIRKAVHLVAVDEMRLAFRPTLMEVEPRVQEIWFPGVHSDIGGGFVKAGLSAITLDFMLDACRRLGLSFLDFEAKPEVFSGVDQNGDEVSIGRQELAIRPDPTDMLHQQERGRILRSKTLAPRTVAVLRDGRLSESDLPLIHHSVVQRIGAVSDYRPEPLRDLPHEILDPDGNKRRFEGLDDHV